MADPKAPDTVDIPSCWGVPGMRVDLKLLREVLSAHGLHVVSEADRKVLEALARLNDGELVSMAQSGSNQQDIVGAELARRSGT